MLFVGLSIQYAAKAAGNRSAINRWRDPLQDLGNDINIYERYNYPNPPIMALILMPVANLPEWTGLPPLVCALAWFYLKVGMTLLALRWVFRMVEGGRAA